MAILWRIGYCDHSVSYSNRRIALLLVLSLVLSLGVSSPALANDVAAHVTSFRGSSLPAAAHPSQIAAASASTQASADKLFHTDLSSLLGTCESVGEVVGSGPNVSEIFAAFRQSGSHREIITNPAWTAMGTGLAHSADGTTYLSVVFCRQAGTPVTVPESTPAQEEAPESTPAPGYVTPAKPLEPLPVFSPALETPAQTPVIELPGEVPALQEFLPAIGARRNEIREKLDRQAKSTLPDWYVGVCGTVDRDRVLEDSTADSGACPKAG